MNSKTKIIVLLSSFLLIIVGTFFFSSRLFSQGSSIAAVVIIILMSIILGIVSLIIKKLYDDLRDDLPADDERTSKVRMYAAGYAYFISLYIWILLFAFHKYLDIDDLLISGLFGMGISFYLSWLILKRKKDFD